MRSPSTVWSTPMDSPYAAAIFKRLHAACCCSCHATWRSSVLRRPRFSATDRSLGSWSRTRQGFHSVGKRDYATKEPPVKGTYSSISQRSANEAEYERSWRPRAHILDTDKVRDFREYDYSTAEQLREKGRRPRRLKMTMRDFIEGWPLKSQSNAGSYEDLGDC